MSYLNIRRGIFTRVMKWSRPSPMVQGRSAMVVEASKCEAGVSLEARNHDPTYWSLW